MKTSFDKLRDIRGAAWVIFATLPYLLLLSPVSSHHELMKEDSLFETVSALLWLCSSCICFYLFLTVRQECCLFPEKPRRNIFFLFLAAVFFFGFGEELSWGQRIFGVETPEPLKLINDQGETNLHNLSGFQLERLFSLFWFSYAFVLPLICRFSTWLSSSLCRINLPLVPFRTGLLFPINYLISKLFEIHFIGGARNFPIEAKEFVFAILFLHVTAGFIGKQRRAT